MRKLATIQKIASIKPIPNADLIEVVTILGWNVVVKKGEFNVGDYCVYIEIDSLLPQKSEFEFLKHSNFKIKTKKIKNITSQGICFPLNILPKSIMYLNTSYGFDMDCKLITNEGDIRPFKEGTDVTDLLGIVKYEAPIPAELAGEVVGAIPSFFEITDEDRIQILPEIVEHYVGKVFIATEKLDGSSTTFYYNEGHFGVCGRNWEYYESSTNSMWKFARNHDLENKLKTLGRSIAIQGEIIGEGIQKNKYKLKGQTVRIFRIFDINKYRYVPYIEMVEIVKQLGIETVPILDWNYILPDNVDDVLEYANGKSVLNKDTYREGVVFVREEDSELGRLSFKSISNKFLIKHNE